MSHWYKSGAGGVAMLALFCIATPAQRDMGRPILASAQGSGSHSTPYSAQTTHAMPDEVGLTWRQVAVMPEPVARPAAATGRDGNIYVFGGIGASAVSNGTFIYHPRTNTWTEGANMPTAREGAQAITLPDGRIVVIGGEARGTTGGCSSDLCQDGTVFAAVEEYAPATNTWRTLAPLMTQRYRFAAVFYRGHIYALGGVDGREVLSRVETYDPRTNTWSYAPPLPQPERAPAAAVVPGGHLIVMGGDNGNSQTGLYSNTFIFDGTSWISGASMPQASEDMPATVGADGLIYVVGGYDAGYLSTVQAYNTHTNTWALAAPLPNGTATMGLATAANGQIYAFGGSGGPGGLVYVFGPTINLASSHAAPGDKDYLNGAYFAANTMVKVYWGAAGSRTVLGSGVTDTTGILTRPLGFRVPCTAGPGAHQITAVDGLSNYPAVVSLKVTKATRSCAARKR
jgi:N-acetylneuraminic acid mutarotase